MWAFECPARIINQDSEKALDACYLVDESGVLFWPGAWCDQPAWFVEAYKIYKTERSKILKASLE